MTAAVDGFRLSPQQKHVWLLGTAEDPVGPYRVRCAVGITGDLDRAALERALGRVVARNEILRTRFASLPGVAIPVQVIEPEVTHLRMELSHLGPGELLDAAARHPLETGPAPLLASWLTAAGPRRHTLILVLPALCADAVSVHVLVREIGRCYEAVVAGADLDDERMQYCDFSDWQNELLDSEEARPGREFWSRMDLDGFARSALPSRRRRTLPAPFAPDELARPLDPAVAARLEAFAAGLGTTVEAIGLAGWQALLGRLGDQPRVTVGVTHDGRKYAELEDALGLFARVLPLPLRVDSDQPFAQHAGRVADLLKETYAWQECFSWQACGSRSKRGTEPFLPFSFHYHSMPEGWSGAGIELSVMRLDPCLDRCELGLFLTGTGPHMEARLRFDPARYDAAEAGRLLARFERLLGSALDRPDAPLAELEIVGDEERRLLLQVTPAETPSPRLLHEPFAERARQSPQAVAVLADGREMSYGDLHARAGRLAGHLRNLGVGPESVVGLCTVRSPEMLVGILGILQAGAAYLPLDPAYPRERTAFMVSDSGARLVLAQGALEGWVRELGVPVVSLEGEWNEERAPAAAAVEPDPANAAYLIYTSGSTGRPKGVVVSHANAVHSTAARLAYYREPVGAYLLLSSFAFDSSVAGIFWTLWQGGRLVLPPEDFQRDLDGLLGLVVRERVTHLLCLPSLYRLLLDRAAPGQLDSLRTVIVAGEACTGELVRRQAISLPAARLFNEYGPTEASVWSTVHECGGPGELLEVPIGRPIPYARVYLRDRKILLAPAGSDAEIYVGGRGIARGYLGQPALTAERFLPDPFSAEPGARLYRTGDLGRWRPDGALLFLGRTDHQVKIRGYRIELGEIEAALERHPAVRQAVVIAVKDEAAARPDMPAANPLDPGSVLARLELLGLERAEPLLSLVESPIEAVAAPQLALDTAMGGAAAPEREAARLRERVERLSVEQRACLLDELEAEPSSGGGNGAAGKRLVAYVAAKSSPGLEAELRSFLEQSLPDYMVPSIFIRLDEMPLTPNGKVHRRALPPWKQARPDRDRPPVPPRTPVERLLAGIWSEVLGLDQVGVQDNFFELGGDSIRSVQVLAKAREKGLSLTLQQVFLHRTIEALAAVAEVVGETQAPLPSWPFSLLSDEDRAALPEGVEDAYPLTRLQAGMLFHSEMSPQEALYVDVMSADMQGRLDLEALRVAIREVVGRHPVLRTSFALTGFSEPLQLVHREAQPELGFEHLGDPGDEQAGETIASWVRSERRRGFDWRRAPLVRFQIHRRGEQRFYFGLTCHHAILDGWSAATLFAELFQVYQPLLEGRTPTLDPPPALRFSEFVALERQALASEESRSYWSAVLAEASVSALPQWPEAYRPAASRPAWFTHVDVPDGVLAALKELARVCGVPLKSVLLAAHLRVISFLMGQPEVLTGVVTNGRPESADGERVLGLFLNTILCHQRLTGGTWEELVRETFAAEQQWMPHRRFPLAELQRIHGGELFDTAFNFTHFHVYEKVEDLGGPRVLNTLVSEQTNFALTSNFSLELAGSRLSIGLVGASSRLAREQLEAIAGYYGRVLESMAEPSARYELIAPLSNAERRAFAESSSGGRDGVGLRPLHSFFEERCRLAPGEVALVWGEERLTRGELNARANRLAHRLLALGVRPESRVAICARRTPDLVCAILGVFKAGGAYVPIDPSYPRERMALMLRASSAEVLLTEPDQLSRLPEHGAREVLLERGLPGGLEQDPGVVVDPDNLAYVIFTSGSTGESKPVGIAHRSASVLVEWAGEVFSQEELDGVLASTSVCFDLSIFELFVPLAHGGRIVLAENVLALPELTSGVTLINTVPSVLSELLRQSALPASVRTVNLAGEALPRSLADGLYATPTVCRVLNLYGPSEDTTYSTWALVERQGQEPPPIGRPILKTRAYVLDSHMQPAPTGTPGELHLGGAGLARGYLGSPAATALSFHPDPHGNEPGARLYRTGDLVRRRPDGQLDYMGRRDQQVKLRGFRIELGEIEVTLRRHPAVREAAVVARWDGPGEIGRLVAYLVPDPGAEPTLAELRDFLYERLPAPMVPSAFVLLDRLPLTPTGKIDRRALPAPDGTSLTPESAYLAPRTPTEELLAGIFAGVLRAERVGRRDNFFEVGGHSLLAIQAISRIRETFAIELPLRSLFQAPTVEILAGLVDEAVRAGAGLVAPPIGPVSRDQPIPLSYAQERLWFLDHLVPDSPYYNIPSAARLDGGLDVRALRGALAEVVRRHEVLRTVYRMAEGGPVQVILPPTEQPLPMVDLQGLPEAARRSEVSALAEKEARHPFDLACGPVLRTTLLREGEEEHVLLFTMHHIASDYWSAGILTRELSLLYQALATGAAPPLSPLAIQYADYAVWERRWLSGGVLEAHLGYWRERLAGAPPLLELPSDRSRPAVQSLRGRREPFHLPAEVSAEVKALANREQVTLFMALLAAFQILLHQATGREDMVIGTDVANRGRLETEPLIGFFVNQLVLRADLSGNPTFRELLARVREATLAAYAHQDLPFERLVEALRPERDLAYAPIFQVKLVLQSLTFVQSEVPGLRLSPVVAEKGTAQLDLVLNLEDTPAGLTGGLEYNTDLFDRETVAVLLEDFKVLLREIVRQPGARLEHLGGAVAAAGAERRRCEEKAIQEALSRRFQKARREVVSG